MGRKKLEPPKNGGARPGAGRKPIAAAKKRRTVGISMAPEMRRELDGYAREHGISRARAAEILLRAGMDSGAPPA